MSCSPSALVLVRVSMCSNHYYKNTKVRRKALGCDQVTNKESNHGVTRQNQNQQQNLHYHNNLMKKRNKMGVLYFFLILWPPKSSLSRASSFFPFQMAANNITDGNNNSSSSSSKPQPIAVETPTHNEDKYEEANVHQVYQEIASHFSETRYKPWPVVETFLNGLPKGSLGADVGCGNGKYLGVNPNVMMLGSDRSANLIEIVCERGFEGMVADGLNLPYRDNAFDFVVSIAVIHHFSTPERRKEAIEELLRITRPGGKVLVFVWALEQTKFTKRNFEPGKQDVFVPWMLKSTGEVYNRYYHLFQKGELDGLFTQQLGGVTIETSGYDRDNHYVIAIKRQ